MKAKKRVSLHANVYIIYIYIYRSNIYIIFTHLESQGFFRHARLNRATTIQLGLFPFGRLASAVGIAWGPSPLLVPMAPVLCFRRFEDLRNYLKIFKNNYSISCKYENMHKYFTLCLIHLGPTHHHTTSLGCFLSLKSHCPKVLPVPGDNWIKHDR